MQDLRYAFRQLVRSPGFTAVALLTLMGTIGLTAMLASLAPLRYALLVSPAETLRAE